MMAKRLALWLALTAFLGALLVLPAAAQTSEPTDDQVNAIAKNLYCPVCENVPLDVCPTQACAQWREMIRQMLAEGRTEEEIQQYFVEQYGARVLAAPPAVGLNWLVYVIPPLELAAGGFVLLRAFRKWRRAATTQTATTPVRPEDPYVARLEEELRRRG
jgi:cytochrome c-type biogenesis protein CcmH